MTATGHVHAGDTHGGQLWCEACRLHPAAALVLWPDEQAALCAGCVATAHELGLIAP